jgi:hypothetical protein
MAWCGDWNLMSLICGLCARVGSGLLPRERHITRRERGRVPAIAGRADCRQLGCTERRGDRNGRHVSSYYGWLIVAAAFCLGCRGWACDAESADIAAESWLQNHAIVYARQRAHPHAAPTWVILYQNGADEASSTRVVHESAVTYNWTLIDGFGFLPSPGGRWLLVWETIRGAEEGSQKTLWFVVELATGRHMKVGEQPGRVGLLPFWLDDDRLSLEKGCQDTVFDARTGTLAAPLPPVAASLERPNQGEERYIDPLQPHDAEAFEWRHLYVEHHFAAEMAELRAFLGMSETAWGMAPYLRTTKWPPPDSPETLLLRPLGVVKLHGHRSFQANWPSVAVSPTHALIARSAVIEVGRRNTRTIVFQAHLDVYDLHSGERVWGTAIAHDLSRRGHGMMPSPFADNVYLDFPNTSEPWFGALRWSSDGKYLSFTNPVTVNGQRTANATVVDARTWRQVLVLEDASDVFVVPRPSGCSAPEACPSS